MNLIGRHTSLSIQVQTGRKDSNIGRWVRDSRLQPIHSQRTEWTADKMQYLIKRSGTIGLDHFKLRKYTRSDYIIADFCAG